MTRKELYSHVVDLGLQEDIKLLYGKNYTQVSNTDLEVVVDSALRKSLGIKNKPSMKTAKDSCSTSSCDSRLNKLVEILQKKNILLKSEVTAIMNA